MPTLTLVSLLAESARPLFRAVAAYLTEHAGVPARLLEGVPWPEQERMLDAGAADGGFLCGLLYSHKRAWLEPLAAPVMRGARYAGRPIYFSDVVVPRASPFERFAELRGARWLFNDRGSFSGYALLRAHLAALGCERAIATGHEPWMSATLANCLAGEPNAFATTFRKGAAALISFPGQPAAGPGTLEWLLQPDALRRVGTATGRRSPRR